MFFFFPSRQESKDEEVAISQASSRKQQVHEQTSITVHEQTSITMHEQTSITMHEQTSIPVHEQTSIPVHELTSAKSKADNDFGPHRSTRTVPKPKVCPFIWLEFLRVKFK
jgi:hypothetical protein